MKFNVLRIKIDGSWFSSELHHVDVSLRCTYRAASGTCRIWADKFQDSNYTGLLRAIAELVLPTKEVESWLDGHKCLVLQVLVLPADDFSASVEVSV